MSLTSGCNFLPGFTLMVTSDMIMVANGLMYVCGSYLP